MPALRSRNWSTVITPPFSAPRPYCTPVLSKVARANPVSGSVPTCLMRWSASAQRTPRGVVLRVVPRLHGHDGRAAAGGVDAIGERQVPREAHTEQLVTADRLALRQGQRCAGRRVQVPEQQGAVRRAGVADRIGEADPRQETIEDARVGVGDRVLHDRPARTAGPDGVGHRPVRLDQPLLGHHRRLGGEHRVAVRLVDEEAVRRHGVTAGQGGRVEHAGGARALVVADVAAAAERHHDLPVPPDLLAQRARRSPVEEGGDLVDPAVDHAALDADDERHGGAADDGGRQIGGSGVRVGERGERAGRRPVLVHDLCGRRAVLVERRPETGGLGLAVERRLVGTREHRAGRRVVLDPQRRRRAGAGHDGDELRATLAQAGDEGAERAAGDLGELVAQRVVVREHAQAVGGGAGGADLEQDVVARHARGVRGHGEQVGLVRLGLERAVGRGDHDRRRQQRRGQVVWTHRDPQVVDARCPGR